MTSTVKNNKLAKVDDEETFKCSIFTSKNSEFFTYEYDINDVAASARNQLTKGFIQDDIIQYSGAAVTTRGRYISKNDYKRNQQDRSLYLYIQGSTKQNIELAVKRISLIIQNESENPNRACGGHEDPHSSPNPTEQHQTKPATTATHVEKLYIGLDGVPASFNLRGKIIGVSGLNLEFIHSETGAAVTLRGQGSLFVEAALGTESTEPLHLFLEHPRPEGLAAARKLAENLVHTLVQELHQTDFQQQQQVINNPPPQMSMPPPPQQHLSAPPQYPTDHPWPSQNNQSNQMSGDQSVSQLQLQQVVMQPPPCPLTIPPPGVHIPEHQGPLVPPPQMVQLSAPPPPGPNPMIPPPPQPIYHSQDMVSSNSMVNYTHMPGNFYQRAPPQNQAPMGNNQNDNSIDPHSQPPPQIITQVQLDPNSQIMNSSNQIPHNFQPNNQPKFQVMGQFQNQNNQLSHMRQSHDNQNDNISHFNDEQHNHQDHLQQTDYNNGKPTLRHMNMYNPFIKQDVRNVQMNMPNPNQIQNQQNFSNNFMPSDNRMSYPILGQMPPNRPHMVSEAPPSNQMFNQFMNHQGNNQNSQMINPMNLNQDQHVNNQFQSMQMSQIPSDNNQQLMHQPGQLNILEMDVNQQNNPRRVKPTDASDSLKDESKKQANPTRRKYRIRKPRNNRSYVPPWSRNEPERPNRPNDRNVQAKEVWEFNKKVNAEPQRVGEERPSRFQPAEDEGRSQDDDNWQSTQYRMNAESGNSLQENNSRFNNSNPLASNNQGPPRNMFTSQYGQGDSKETQLNRNRNNPEQRKARSPEGGRKRKFEQENDWVNQSENQISDSAMSSHKKRNDQEEYQAGAAGSQCSGKSAGNNSSKTGEPTKSAKSSPSKCSDLKDEIKLEETDTTESPDDDNVSPKKIEVSNTKEKRTETGTAPSNKKPQSWPEQRIEYRSSPVQYTHNINQFQGQSAPMNNDNSMNHQYQQNYQPYMNTGQMFQGNMPYHLPPPPPPPGQGQNNSMQLQQPNMQFNGIQGNNAPPNMMMSNNNQCYGQNPQGHSMMNVSQNMLPNMNPHNQMQAMNCNVGQNMHHNTQYDMSQNMMNMGHQMMPNNNYMVPPNMPPGMNQMPSMNMGQNMSSNMGQMMPNQMQNMGQNMQHNMGQHLMPNMGQNPSSFMGQNAPNNMQHMGQNMMNQNMNSNMPQGGLMNNQNMGQGMPLMMNNSNQSMMNNNQMGMGMSMGQTGHVGSPMVAPPTNGPPPMIPCGLQHTAPPPPPPYPYFNN